LEARRRTRHARLVASVIAGGIVGAAVVAASASAVAAPAAGCQPGSGRQFVGHHFTTIEIMDLGTSGALRCANLTGADFTGVSLIQVDLTAALLHDANLQHVDLGQATLKRAVLTGANLTDATLDQAEMQGANFSDANLSGASMVQVFANSANFTGANLGNVDLTQADLTNANLSDAKIGSASFTQTTLSGTNFKGATGVPPWSTYLLILAIVILVLLVLGTIRSRLRGASLRRRPNYAISKTGRAQANLALSLIGALVIAFGVHLLVGGLVGTILSASGPPVSQTCTAGPLCSVGIASGFVGLFVGAFVIIIGGVVRAGRRRSTNVAFSPGRMGGQFGPGNQFGPSGPGNQFGQGGQGGFGGPTDAPPSDAGGPTW
jgi:uncharacterized protein YjbI with pentapeptide repeats